MAPTFEPRILLLVAAGGAVGAVLRYGTSALVTRGAFPAGTLVVNVVGSFLLALLLFHDLATGSLGPSGRALFGIGVLGAFTTMSTLSYETIAMLDQGQTGLATWNASLNLGLSVGAALLGRAVAHTLTHGATA